MLRSDNLAKGSVVGLAILCAVGATPVAAGEADKAKITVDERFRYEFVDQASKPKDAHAKTLRSRIGLISPKIHSTRVAIEYENITEIGDDTFNNTINGNTNRPVVVDVESNEVNQAYIEYSGIPGVVLTGGRYRKNIDNMRFVGSVGWRQNDQTFDGATVTLRSIPGVTASYDYIGNVNRIFSSRSPVGDLESNIHLAHIKSDPLQIGTLTGYTYLIDIMDADRLSNASYGLHLKGKKPLGPDLSFNYYLEYAHQTDYGDHPLNYSTNYVRVAPGLSSHGLTTTFVYERLGSDDGVVAFQTPLATGHVFNGFADVFLATPAAGLQDFFVDVTYKVPKTDGPFRFLGGLLLKAQYHEFRSDEGGMDFGSEFDAYAKMPLGRGFYIEGKYANFRAEEIAVDTEKFIFGLGYKTAFSPEDWLGSARRN